MKKLIFALAAVLILSSCYNTRVFVGDVKPKEPLVEVNSEWNHHFLFGLIPSGNATMQATDYVNSQPNYVVKTYTSFLSGLVGGITMGIYTPTQTKYYLPVKDYKKE